MEKIAQVEKFLDEKLSAIPAIEQAERQIGIRKTHMVGSLAILLLASLLTLLFPGLLTAVLSLAYPLWATARAADAHDKAEDVQWLSYWLCYGLLALFLDVLSAPLLKRVISPSVVVSVSRLVFLMFLYLPMTRGATVVWQQVLRPVLHALYAVCPGLSGQGDRLHGQGHSKHNNTAHHFHNKKRGTDMARTLNEMRNRNSSKSGSGDEDDAHEGK